MRHIQPRIHRSNRVQNNDFKRTYLVNKEAVISLKKGFAKPDEYYLFKAHGKNLKLVLVSSPDKDQSIDQHYCRRVRDYEHRSLSISIPHELASPDQLYRIIKTTDGTIWLLSIEEFLIYADETSLPAEVINVL